MITMLYPDAFLWGESSLESYKFSHEKNRCGIMEEPFISYWGPVRQEMLIELNDNSSFFGSELLKFLERINQTVGTSELCIRQLQCTVYATLQGREWRLAWLHASNNWEGPQSDIHTNASSHYHYGNCIPSIHPFYVYQTTWVHRNIKQHTRTNTHSQNVKTMV